MKQKEKGFAAAELVIILFVAVFVGIIFLHVSHKKVANPLSSFQKSSLQRVCSNYKTLYACLQTGVQQATISDEIKLKLTLQNTSSTPYTEHFSTGCTDPDLEVNGKNINFNKICLQVLSSIDIAGNATKTYDLKMPAADLDQVNNDIRALWGGLRTSPVQIHLNLAKQSGLSDQLANCQKKPPADYCLALSITVKPEAVSKWTCGHWQEVMKAQKLSVECSSSMALGIAEVYVPKLELNKWITTLGQLPDIQQVAPSSL
jgi:hypothetical protein